MEVEAWTLASGDVIPSCNCTAMFDFSYANYSYSINVARNSLSWTCVSEPVRTWDASTYHSYCREIMLGRARS